MVLKNSLKRLSSLTAGAVLAVVANFGASATAPVENWNVASDPGTYAPLVMDETITLNGCASTFYNADSPGQSYSICDLASLDDFTLRWKASTDGNSWTWVTNTYGANSGNNGTLVTLATGAGTFFENAGTYYIGLYLTVDNETSVLLPSGSTVFTNSNFDQGNKVSGFSQSFSIGGGSASVPEPEAALLLLPALALLALSERRRRRAQKA